MLSLPSLSKRRFGAVEAYTDEALFDAVGVRIAFTTRAGGVSSGAYESLNLGSHVSDDVALVQGNRRIVQRAFNCQDAPLVVPTQVHGDTVLQINSVAEAPLIREQADAGADALLVNTSGVGALLCFADCVPVIAVAPTGAFAVIHAGWRGVENCISAKAVRMMAAQMAGVGMAADGVDAGGVAADKAADEAARGFNIYIGPYIHHECFETSDEIRARFQQKFGASVASDAHHVDLAQCLRVQLQEVGVAPDRICDVDICTVCNNQEFFSFRAQDGVAGRHGAFAIRISH